MLKLHWDNGLSALTSFNRAFEEAVKTFERVTTQVVITAGLDGNTVIYERKHREFGLRSVRATPCGENEIRVTLIGDGEINTIRFTLDKLLESDEWFDQFIQFLIDGSLKLLKESK